MTGILSKSGIATQRVARVLCSVQVGDRIPTVDELVSTCGVVRGNVQKALRNLKDLGAVQLEAHGQNGTILLSIDYLLIASACGIDHLVGVMPLPYTGRYEGLATGLFTLMGRASMRSYISFMRGSEIRVRSLLDGSADYCVMSSLAFRDCIGRGFPIVAALDCGPNSYVGRHVLLMKKGRRARGPIKKVGIDETSADQMLLTKKYFSGKDVEFVPTQYTQIVGLLKSGEIDVGIWNEDDLHLNEEGLCAEPLGWSGTLPLGDTQAIVAVRNDDFLTMRLIREQIDVDELLSIQQKVMRGILPAKY